MIFLLSIFLLIIWIFACIFMPKIRKLLVCIAFVGFLAVVGFILMNDRDEHSIEDDVNIDYKELDLVEDEQTTKEENEDVHLKGITTILVLSKEERPDTYIIYAYKEMGEDILSFDIPKMPYNVSKEMYDEIEENKSYEIEGCLPDCTNNTSYHSIDKIIDVLQ